MDPVELGSIASADKTPQKESGAKGFTFDMPIMPQTVEFNDADIDIDSAVPNDFSSFFDSHPEVRRIGFNGRKAEDLYRRLVIPQLRKADHELISLPSTSPAYAAMSFDKKLRIWRSMLATNES